ncbi:hypothetical protein [Pedococcus bigeumensis]|uniref:hypothetical protein n=1 Tax=Pedococcus bigeumensis TaxID=433644 RepID=UPI002FED6660
MKPAAALAWLRCAGARAWIAAFSLLVVVITAWDPAAVLLRSAQPTSLKLPVLGLLLASGGVLVASVWVQRFSYAQSFMAAWTFVFLGMTGALQGAQGRYPWHGSFSTGHVTKVAWIALLGFAVMATLSFVPRLPWQRVTLARTDHAVRSRLAGTPSIAWALVGLQLVSTLLLVGYLGPHAMVNGREEFKAALAQAVGRPGLGSAFFLATALGMVLPAALLWLRRHRHCSWLAVVLSVIAGAVANNPLIGSRFLTACFGVALVCALLNRNLVARLLPAGMVLGLLFVFPSLDLWRGDGTGSHTFTVASPRSTLATGDFDAFEMTARAVEAKDAGNSGLQSPGEQAGSALFYWVPGLARHFPKVGSGSVVGTATGMTFTNVSMPLQGEGYLLGGIGGALGVCALMGLWLQWLRRGSLGRSGWTPGPTDAATGALLFIVLRGSIMSVLDYLLAAVFVGVLLQIMSGRRAGRRRRP